MSSAFDPLPEERGDHQPPRRRPPTAIGVMTPPPPDGPLSGRHRIPWSRALLALAVFSSPVVVGIVSWLLMRGTDNPWWRATAWLVAALAAGIAGLLVWVAGVLPLRDHLRTRAADRLSHAR